MTNEEQVIQIRNEEQTKIREEYYGRKLDRRRTRGQIDSSGWWLQITFGTACSFLVVGALSGDVLIALMGFSPFLIFYLAFSGVFAWS